MWKLVRLLCHRIWHNIWGHSYTQVYIPPTHTDNCIHKISAGKYGYVHTTAEYDSLSFCSAKYKLRKQKMVNCIPKLKWLSEIFMSLKRSDFRSFMCCNHCFNQTQTFSCLYVNFLLLWKFYLSCNLYFLSVSRIKIVFILFIFAVIYTAQAENHFL